jgi:cation:H+ antiporter
MLFYVLLFVFGLFLMIKGSDWVTNFASRLAKLWNISELIIGITIVAMSTSLPELSVSLVSAITKTSKIAIGTIIGSNIANIGLIIGLSSIFAPLTTKYEFVKQEYVMLLFTIAVSIFLLGGMVWYEGLILLLGFILYMYYLIKKAKGTSRLSLLKRWKKRENPLKYMILCIAGGIVVVVGAELIVYSTINIANSLSISELLIALIAIAIGTSLPELAVSITAAMKKMRGISVGNVTGSNIFNISILAMTSLLTKIPVTSLVITIDIPIMLILSLLLLIFVRTKWKISRREGFILLLIYFIFVVIQFTHPF